MYRGESVCRVCIGERVWYSVYLDDREFLPVGDSTDEEAAVE